MDLVDVNLGGAYDPASSQFVAPVNGAYVIMAAVSCQEGKTITEVKVRMGMGMLMMMMMMMMITKITTNTTTMTMILKLITMTTTRR